MYSKSIKALGALALTAAVGCASTPPNVQQLSGADPTVEIQKTEQMISEASAQQYDVLSPKNFTDAKEALDKAKKYKSKDKPNEKILEQVAFSRAWLNQAKEKSQLSENVLKDITDARGGALSAKANEFFPKDWSKANDKLEDITSSIEKGNLSPADKKGTDVTQDFRNLERRAVVQTSLGQAGYNIEQAEKNGAKTKAPRTYGIARAKFDSTFQMIQRDPRNTDAIRAASADATRESARLIDVAQKVNMGNSEDLVLLADRQQRTISGLKREVSSTENQLNATESQLSATEKEKMEIERRERLLSRAERVRSQLKPGEADVITEGSRITVRLKGMKFPVNQSTLGPRNEDLLRRVQAALKGVGASKVTVEGHTDSTGSADVNLELSQKRAESVEKYMLTNGILSKSQIEAVGMGYDHPIGNNKTPLGRAQNRRIDLVVETQAE